MANENMSMSASGRAELRRREDVRLQYYNDLANNCTFGVGALAHHGPCTAEELVRPVTAAQVDAQLATRLHTAEAGVRRHVNRQTLTQAQFDALVSYTFNLGVTGTRSVLDAANRGADADVVTHMNNNVFVRPRDARGRRLRAIRSQGLANRRREETAPFQPAQPTARPAR
ncbi:glycoside hydrolase family protein [Variovorax sp. 2RAF20]